jgi:hypothetical protein
MCERFDLLFFILRAFEIIGIKIVQKKNQSGKQHHTSFVHTFHPFLHCLLHIKTKPRPNRLKPQLPFAVIKIALNSVGDIFS